MTTIDAYAVRRQGGTAEPLSYQRALGPNDVLVRVTHCSIARGDVQFIDNDSRVGAPTSCSGLSGRVETVR